MLHTHPAQNPNLTNPAAPTRLPKLRRCGTVASTGLALALLLGACGDDGGTTVADGSGEQPAASDSENNDTVDPGNAADGDSMINDELGGGDIDPAAGGSTFNPVAGDWTLESLTIEGDMAIPLEDELRPTLNVQGTDITGTTGCNSYGSSVAYDIAADSFTAELGTMTEMACTDNDIEKWFLQALNSVTRFTSEPGVLILTDGADAPTTMRFTIELPPENPEEELAE